MEVKVFLGRSVFHAIATKDGFEKMQQAVISCMEDFFPGGIDPDEYSQGVASGAVDSILNFRLEVDIDERADHEIVYRDSFKPALEILRVIGGVLEKHVGNIVGSLTLIVKIKLELVHKNHVYDTLHYRGRAMFENGLLTILREKNTGASSL